MPEIHPEQQRDFALSVLKTLREAGFEAYWAGGCVRDQLLGRTPKDYDVATAARPDEVRQLFGRRRTLSVGEAFGVIVVVGRRGAGQVEVTTFRHDAAYSDGRHPDHVTFSTAAEEDVKRRDFTINGMLYDPLADEVLDFVGGRSDLRRGVIRAIGDPRKRFGEDKLRMLRAARFAARFSFRLESGTRDAVKEMAEEITVVAAERIAQEMRPLLSHESREAGVDLCMKTSLFAAILPEVLPLRKRRHSSGGSLWTLTRETLRRLGPVAGFSLALAALLHRVHRQPKEAAAMARKVCRRWKLSNEETNRAVWLIAHQAELDAAPDQPWSRLQPLLVSDGIDELLQFNEALAGSTETPADHIVFCREKLNQPTHQLNPPPLLTGNDLIEHDVPRGKIYQTLLQTVRNAQLDRRIHNKAQALALVDEILT